MPPANTPRIIRYNINSSAQLNAEPNTYLATTFMPLTATIPTRASAASAMQTPASASPRRTAMPRHALSAFQGSRSIAGSIHAVGGGLELVVELLRRRVPGKHRLHGGGDALGRILLLGWRKLDDLAAFFRPRLAVVGDTLNLPLVQVGLDLAAGLRHDLLQIARQTAEPYLAHQSDRHQRPQSGVEHVGGRVIITKRHECADHRIGAVDRALLDRRQHLRQRHRHRRSAECDHRRLLALGGQNADAFAGKIRQLGDRRLEGENLLVVDVEPNRDEPAGVLRSRIGSLREPSGTTVP